MVLGGAAGGGERTRLGVRVVRGQRPKRHRVKEREGHRSTGGPSHAWHGIACSAHSHVDAALPCRVVVSEGDSSAAALHMVRLSEAGGEASSVGGRWVQLGWGMGKRTARVSSH